MNTALWIVAGLMAAVFLLAGFNKLFIPRAKLAKDREPSNPTLAVASWLVFNASSARS
jgi:hypothetical protein